MVFRILAGFGGIVLAIGGCSSSSNLQEKTKFTKLDSLTDTYLVYQDSLLQSWSLMVKTENEKAKSLQEIFNDLAPGLTDKQLVASFQTRIDQLERIRFTQKSLGNIHVVDEYDHALESILKDLEVLHEKARGIDTGNLVDHVEWIKKAQIRSGLQRYRYDSIAYSFNKFLESNKNYLEDIERNIHLENKPLFKSDSLR
jgi:hypothetical protein